VRSGEIWGGAGFLSKMKPEIGKILLIMGLSANFSKKIKPPPEGSGFEIYLTK
jgi:hypothetical protein